MRTTYSYLSPTSDGLWSEPPEIPAVPNDPDERASGSCLQKILPLAAPTSGRVEDGFFVTTWTSKKCLRKIRKCGIMLLHRRVKTFAYGSLDTYVNHPGAATLWVAAVLFRFRVYFNIKYTRMSIQKWKNPVLFARNFEKNRRNGAGFLHGFDFKLKSPDFYFLYPFLRD